ncbi:secretin N-terminal domain-containing protein [Novipirellula aureliae]|uniref:secretin N-terminal domain-containing protein n=1 Tax=Novipirellula aureliae TaxID=2527966 RepID=UPI001E2DED82|nr:secretin N-terminal domain-containing protein [Novipirellula aureliae]
MRFPAFHIVVCLSLSVSLSGLADAVAAFPQSSRIVQTAAQNGVVPTAIPSGAAKKSEQNVEKAANEKAGDKQPKKESSSEPKVIRRPDNAEDASIDSDQLTATVGEDGRVAFHFRDQPWVELVQWLAEISDQPLDWLELPADRVNLSSPGRYTVAETRDLFNRYLLARGYTILELDGGLTVAKTETMNPAIVPRVTPEQLASLPPHSFVRTSLDVGWLSAEKLAEELKPMVSSNGRLIALSTTNRIEVLDAAINVRQVAELLAQERSVSSREALAPEFALRHIPAEEAKRMLEEFLGVDKKNSAPMTAQQMMAMQQMQQRGGGGQPAPVEKKTEVSIVANSRQNSVIIRAPADRVAIATEFLKRIDVPSKSMVSLADIEDRVQVFRLASLDPEKLIEIVSEMNILEPTTRVRVDKDNNALIVSGSPADRFIIKSLIERLDGSGRNFHVLQLRRLDAGEVAESIAFLMGQKDGKDKQNNNQRYNYWDSFSRQEEDEKEKDEFRVAANNRNRQVLLWANEMEMEQVESLLIKLGELPPPGGSPRTVRVIEASATPETLEYLKRLKVQWDRVSPNPLEIPSSDQFDHPLSDEMSPKERDKWDDADGQEASLPSEPNGVREDHDVITFASTGKPEYQLAWDYPPAALIDDLAPTKARTENARPAIQSTRDFDREFGDQDAPDAANPTQTSTGIRIEVDSSGNLILSSPDTKALDQLELLMQQVAPPKRPYVVFKIENTTAYWMRLNLEEFFEDEEEKEGSGDSFLRMYWGMAQDDSSEEPSGLGKGNKLKFVDDADTNTLVVSGATADQLRTIRDLIRLWDVEALANNRRARFTKLVQIHHGNAKRIAETVKEAYRDLLSSNDKTFQGGGGAGGEQAQRAQKNAARNRSGSGSELVASEGGGNGGNADFSFKGKLSIGVDEVGNTLLISAEGEPLLNLICEMVEQLDNAALSSGEVQVLKLSGSISSGSLQSALKSFGADRRTQATTEPPSLQDNPK